MADDQREQKSWKLIINPSWPHRSELLYKGEKVGLVRAVDFKVGVDCPIPILGVEVYTRDIEIVTQDKPPPGHE